ncbi:hypothetical protein ACFB49_07870 [Sphingomonas sp. DBB INV C78]|uniref:EthD domain-containing protein n=1 Tax=Sphingomonas sp. DBB INV C78 TaxID=3349434 RepID=UPI0036D23342
MSDLLLLASGDGAPEALGEALRAASDGLPGVERELAVLMPADALPALAHAATADPALPHAILTLRGDAAAAAMRIVVEQVGDRIDPVRSTVLATTRHAILPGVDAIRLFFGLRRLERLSQAEFQDYWLNRHADFGRRLIPPYTYHQLHADPQATGEVAAATGLPASTFDGVVEVHFPDVPALVAQLSRPDVAQDALADERNFIDHARSIFWAYRTIL